MKSLLCAILASILFFGHPALADQEPMISVTGNASIEVAPDIMHWQLNIKNTGAHLEKVAQSHAVSVSDVVDLLLQHGIKHKAIQTTNMRFNEKFKYVAREKLNDGYLASTMLSFKLTALDKYSILWMNLAKHTEVSIQSVSYDTSKRVELQHEARVKALLAAKQKATVMASTLGSTIDKVITISESSSHFYPESRARNVARLASDSANGSVNQLATGMIKIDSSVSVSFSLDN